MSSTISELRELSVQIDKLFIDPQTEEGRGLLKKALAVAEDVDKAYALFFQGEWAGYVDSDSKKQESLFTQAIELRPDDSFLLRNFGALLANLDREDEAIKYYDKALRLDPSDSVSLAELAISLGVLGRFEEAIPWFEKALKVSPEDTRILRNYGTTLINANRPDEALPVFEKALTLSPSDATVTRGHGISLTKLGRRDEALPWYDKAINLDPNDEANFYWKALTLSQLGVLDEALPLAEKAVQLAPSDGDNLSLYNLIAGRLGKPVKTKTSDAARPAADKTAPTMEDVRSKGSVAIQKDLLLEVVRQVQKTMGEKKDRLLEQMRETEERRRQFLEPTSRIQPSETVFLVLRKWNSYTPIIPDAAGERHVGGGYFIYVQGRGTVIDPGHNFIENLHSAGFNIHDVHNIVITHAHNDHTADLESLLTLAYEYNEGIKDGNGGRELKRLNLYLNTGTFMKFSGVLDLRRSAHIERVHTLMADHIFDLGNGLSLTALPAYHDEVITKDYAIGLSLVFCQGEERKHILITSDTCLLPRSSNGDGVDASGKEVWETYPNIPIDLLVVHLGSIRREEFLDPQPMTSTGEPAHSMVDLLYKNHLGIIGSVRVITSLRPALALISEFGEELATVQEELIELTDRAGQEFCAQTGQEPIKVLPADISFVYRVWDAKAYCIWTKTFIDASRLDYSVPNPTTKTFYYFDKDVRGQRTFAQCWDWALEFEKNREARKKDWLYFC